MMHENNRKTITNWKPENFAEAYRDYQDNWMFVKSWYSFFMPEEDNADLIYEFYKVCEKFHEIGF